MRMRMRKRDPQLVVPAPAHHAGLWRLKSTAERGREGPRGVISQLEGALHRRSGSY